MQRGDEHARGRGANEHKVSAGGMNKCRGTNAAMTAAGMVAAVLCGPPPPPPSLPLLLFILLVILLVIFTYFNGNKRRVPKVPQNTA